MAVMGYDLDRFRSADKSHGAECDPGQTQFTLTFGTERYRIGSLSEQSSRNGKARSQARGCLAGQ
jgi:hypothetical protein